MDCEHLLSASLQSHVHSCVLFLWRTLINMLQDTLMNLAKAVANAAAMLVLKAKNVAQVAEDTVLQNRVIAAATQCALSTSQLVACTKVHTLNFLLSWLTDRWGFEFATDAKW